MKEDDLIFPYAKEYFIVEFDLAKDKHLITRPCFYVNSGLCMNPWTHFFYPMTNILPPALARVRLPNLPLYFWGLPSLQVIDKSLKGSIKEVQKHRSKVYTHMLKCV